MRLSNVVDYLVYLVVRVLVCVIQAASLETCASACRGMALFTHKVLRIRRRVVEENLQRAFPEMSDSRRDQIALGMWEHLFLMLVEIAHTPRKIRIESWRRYLRLQNAVPLIRSLVDERPAVVVAGHYGNFELSGFVLAMFGFDSFSVARPLDNPYLRRFINQFRGTHGLRILPKIGSSQEVERMLAAGATLAVLGDQSAGPKGVFVDFFGQAASTNKAIALFALQYDAVVVVGYARRVGKPLHYDMGVQRVVDPRDIPPGVEPVTYLTSQFTEALEQIIRDAPEQYWWLHRRWKDKPRRRKAAAAAA